MAKPTTTATDIRRLAEALDGDRNRVVTVVLRGGKPTHLQKGESTAQGETELFTVETDDLAPGRESLRGVKVAPRIKAPKTGAPIDQVVDVFDALFWSEPAVRKFVLPYYLGLLTPKDVDDLWRTFLGEPVDGRPGRTVYAFGHLPYSETMGLEPAGARTAMVLVVDAAPAGEKLLGEAVVMTPEDFLTELRR